MALKNIRKAKKGDAAVLHSLEKQPAPLPRNHVKPLKCSGAQSSLVLLVSSSDDPIHPSALPALRCDSGTKLQSRETNELRAAASRFPPLTAAAGEGAELSCPGLPGAL